MRAVTTGIFALAGVLIGALATATMQWFFERRREQRSALVAALLVREQARRVREIERQRDARLLVEPSLFVWARTLYTEPR